MKQSSHLQSYMAFPKEVLPSTLLDKMGSPEWRAKVDDLYKSMSGEEGKRWARPDAPILHDLSDEKAEPHVFFHNTNYRISRKYINVEKVKVRCSTASLKNDESMPDFDCRFLSSKALSACAPLVMHAITSAKRCVGSSFVN